MHIFQIDHDSYITADTTATKPAWQEGLLFWDTENHTYAIYNDQSDITIQIGQETLEKIYAGEDILNGDAVTLSGSHLTYPIGYKAVSDGVTTKYNVAGVATQNITSGSKGYVTVQGRVNDIDTSEYPAGSALYLSNTVPGRYMLVPPPEPSMATVIGHCLYQDATTGKMLVNISLTPESVHPFVGMLTTPTISIVGHVVTIGSGTVALSTTANGLGTIKAYTVPAKSFTISSTFLDSQYIVATYNGGSPIYDIVTNTDEIDNIQSTAVYTITVGAGGTLSYVSWDAPGVLLANKIFTRINNVNGIERETGLVLGETSPRRITVTSGSAWQGVQEISLSAVNSATNRFVLVFHSGSSAFSSSLMTQYNNTQYDDGTQLQSLTGNRFTVNWVYRGIGNLNTTVVMLGTQYSNFTDAVAAQPPTPPSELRNIAVLVGRAIYQQNNAAATQIDSAFTQTFSPAGITDHNLLNNLQGGTANQYYHLTAAEYGNTSSGSFVRRTGSVSNAISASYANHALSASWAPSALSTLSDVALATPTLGDILVYGAAGGSRWNNSKRLTGNYIVSGSIRNTGSIRSTGTVIAKDLCLGGATVNVGGGAIQCKGYVMFGASNNAYIGDSGSEGFLDLKYYMGGLRIRGYNAGGPGGGQPLFIDYFGNISVGHSVPIGTISSNGRLFISGSKKNETLLKLKNSAGVDNILHVSSSGCVGIKTPAYSPYALSMSGSMLIAGSFQKIYFSNQNSSIQFPTYGAQMNDSFGLTLQTTYEYRPVRVAGSSGLYVGAASGYRTPSGSIIAEGNISSSRTIIAKDLCLNTSTNIGGGAIQCKGNIWLGASNLSGVGYSNTEGLLDLACYTGGIRLRGYAFGRIVSNTQYHYIDQNGDVSLGHSLAPGAISSNGRLFISGSKKNETLFKLKNAAGVDNILHVSSSACVGIKTPADSRYTLKVNGNIYASQGITGSLFGTASYANHALSASWAPGAGGEPTRIINGSVSASISPAGGLQVNTPASFEGDVLVTGYIVNTKTPPANSNMLGYQAGFSASVGTEWNNFIGYRAGSLASGSISGVNFIGFGAGRRATNANSSNFIGFDAGNRATYATDSNFIGTRAGIDAENAVNSNFIGWTAGLGAINAASSNFIGEQTGWHAEGATVSNFIGQNAGYSASYAHHSNFIGQSVGCQAIYAVYSNFIGAEAGSGATNANDSNFIGTQAGFSASNAYDGVFIGGKSGYFASNARHSIFMGSGSGYYATDAHNGVFIGKMSGYSASNANNSVFVGDQTGYTATNAYTSVFIGKYAGQESPNAHQSNFIGDSAGIYAANANNSNFIGTESGENATNAENSNFIGTWAGINAAGASFSNFMGNSAGINATSATNSNFIGGNAGSQATNAHDSNFIGPAAGILAVDAYESNFIGLSAGSEATNANNSNFIGYAAGQNSVNAAYSNFIGRYAGVNATNANNSIFIGYSAGYADTVNNSVIGKSSILIGDYTSTGGNSNSIAIGQGVQNTLPEQVSIGNVLFATGIYTGTTPTGTVQSNGKVGIRVSNPVNALDVDGNISATIMTASLFAGTASYANRARSASWAPSNGGGTTLHTGSTYPITSSWAMNARSASVVTTATNAINATSASYLLGYRDTNRIIDQSWEFFSSGTSAIMYDGWNMVGGFTGYYTSAELGHPGVVRRSSATAANQSNSFTPGVYNYAMIALGDFRSFEAILRPVQTTADHIIRIGLFTDLNSITQTKAFYFERTGSVGSITGSWRYAARSASVNQSFTTGVKYGTAATDWHNYKIYRDSATNKISFIIDGVTYGTSSYNLPLTTGLVFGVQIYPTVTGMRQFDIDYARITSYPITTAGR